MSGLFSLSVVGLWEKMRPCLLAFLACVELLSSVAACYFDTSITGKKRIELTPILIETKLNDIALISVPEIGGKNAGHSISKPNGEVIELDERWRTIQSNEIFDYKDETSRDVINCDNLTIKYELFNVNENSSKNNDFEDHQKYMRPNDFLLGPFNEDDHGNWVISISYTYSRGDDIEVFQVMSVEIVETVPARKSIIELNEGNTFKPSFAYSITNLVSCELIAPRTAQDRFYDRDKSFNNCGYIIPNVTRDDEGTWEIVGMGPIVYKATVRLKIRNKSL